ncbi:MAG: hypothetical protein N3B10_08620 [Armatimonadetes bacterium]|nr:hypothetical protein [Armatimonadota bacterium]MCX7968537.1 hypothetical protein [Armatimonadota bacterium]MDW8142167.1 hypothetical protein [Armatimonadota bacterium]
MPRFFSWSLSHPFKFHYRRLKADATSGHFRTSFDADFIRKFSLQHPHWLAAIGSVNKEPNHLPPISTLKLMHSLQFFVSVNFTVNAAYGIN